MCANIPQKFFSLLLALVMTITAVSGVHGGDHTLQSNETIAVEQSSPLPVSEPEQCPASPREQHNDFDGCDTCVNCACHAPLIVQAIQLSYKPSVRENVTRSTPFNFLPEVYLSLFVPPDSAAV